MTDSDRGISSPLRQRLNALSRWDYEGGAGPDGPQTGSIDGKEPTRLHAVTNAELVQLRVRVIALENLVIAFLAEASERQLGLVRDMADYISPRPGVTRHPLTIHAAAQMVNLVERAGHFRTMVSGASQQSPGACDEQD